MTKGQKRSEQTQRTEKHWEKTAKCGDKQYRLETKDTKQR